MAEAKALTAGRAQKVVDALGDCTLDARVGHDENGHVIIELDASEAERLIAHLKKSTSITWIHP